MLHKLFLLVIVLMFAVLAVDAGDGSSAQGVEISSPYGYKVPTAAYNINIENANICVDYKNENNYAINLRPRAYFFSLTTSNGIDVSSGFPAIDEWTLANNVWDYNEPQILRDIINKESIVLMPGQVKQQCWNYDPQYTGYYQVDFTATGYQGLGAWAFIRVINGVNPGFNTPPHIDIPDQVAIVDQPMNSILLDYFASDNEQQDSELTFTILDNTHPEIVSATIQNGNLLVFGIPQQVGITQIKVQVSDGQLMSEDTFIVTVLDNGTSNNLLPVAIIQIEPGNTGIEPFNVEFDGSFSYDLDGQIMFYFWSFGDGSIWFGKNVEHEYDNIGIYQATLTVFDNDLASDSATVWINVDDGNSTSYQCSDNLDNDGDGLIDYPNDPGCSNPYDDDETNNNPPVYQCSDNLDNDGDGLIDYPNDPGCYSALDDDETNNNPPVYQCSDNLDNDGDGLIDYPNDPGCLSLIDNDEYNFVSQCSDNLDNDGDGLIDYPNDPGCENANDNDENNAVYQCSDNLDNDGDGKIDYPLDPGCTSSKDNSEQDINDTIIHACEDGLDNDGDGLIDMQDPGCQSVHDNTEEDVVYADNEEFFIRATDYYQNGNELRFYVKIENTGHMDQTVEIGINNLQNTLMRTTTVRLTPQDTLWKEVYLDLNGDFEDYGFNVFRVTATNNRYISYSLYSNVYLYDFRE